MNKYKALAYIGVYQLHNLGVFDTREEAEDALQEEHDRQAEQEEQSENDSNSCSESFWANSQIEELI